MFAIKKSELRGHSDDDVVGPVAIGVDRDHRRFHFLGRLRHLADDLARPLVASETLEGALANVALLRPTGEFHLRDQFRPDKFRRPADRRRNVIGRGRLHRPRSQFVPDRLQLTLAVSRADLAAIG